MENNWKNNWKMRAIRMRKRSNKKLREMLIDKKSERKIKKLRNNARCMYQRDWKFRFFFVSFLFTKCKMRVNDTLTRQLIFFRVLSDIKIFRSKLKYSIAHLHVTWHFLFVCLICSCFLFSLSLSLSLSLSRFLSLLLRLAKIKEIVRNSK